MTRKFYRKKGKAYYDWMHPSWRDLVIDHLASNSSSRKRFLSYCGIQGAMLALSSAGGTEGKRQKPLLITPEDWEVFASNTVRLLESLDSESIYSLLTAILHAIQHDAQNLRSAGNGVSQLEGLAQKALETCYQQWNLKNCEIPVGTLKVYYALSELLPSLPPGPDLTETWKHVFFRANQQLSVSEDDLVTSVDEIVRWTELIKPISENEPRFLRKVGFPSDFIQTVGRFLDLVENQLEFGVDCCSDEEYGEEIERLSELTQVTNNLGRAFETLDRRAGKIATRLSARRTRLEEERSEEYPEPDYDPGDYGPSGGIDVEEILRDL